jgi:hypothetical protein
MDRQPKFGDRACRLRPKAALHQFAHMALVIEARHGVVGLRLQKRFGYPSALLRFKQRQAAAMDEIVDEGGDEDGFSGARQARHAQPQRGRGERGQPVGKSVQRDLGFVCD